MLPQLAKLPLVLAGPILRRTNHREVTVWLATKEARSLVLEVYQTQDGGRTVGKLLFKGSARTIPLGDNLHIATITATADVPLRTARIYAYNLRCLHSNWDLVQDQQRGNSFSYFSHQLPTFCLPSADLDSLKLVHGSCRKPHGGGRDTLSCLDDMIAEGANSPTERPQQLFMTGDQIYGDDVADPMLWSVQQLIPLLFGWQEPLPLLEGTILAEELPPGRRSEIARIEGGFTAMLRGNEEKAKSHLFSFAEYAVTYLLSWSPVLIPSGFPDRSNLDTKAARKWQDEVEDTRTFFGEIFSVRRAMANIAVYTICDDHDISDDWYLNRSWCDRVLGKPLGKRVVQNGLLAYALFQAWGNTPEQFAEGTSGAKLIGWATQWLESQGRDEAAKLECDRYLGIPGNDPNTGLPLFVADEDNLVFDRDSAAIPWHYTVTGSKHEVIALDTRTWRGYPAGKDEGLQPPMLLSHCAFTTQLQQPLQQSSPEIEATFVVLPTNLVALGIIDRVQQYALSRNRVYSTDVGDSWNFHQEAFATLLLHLCQEREQVIILSGDIHYSCAVSLTHWDFHRASSSTVVQLTSSAIKNSELSTRMVHTRLKDLFPERSEHHLGWNNPLTIASKHQAKNKSPDWEYRIQWHKRFPVQTLPWHRSTYQPKQKLPWQQKLINKLANFFWRNRWLQEGSEVVGRNNLSLVRLRWEQDKAVIQETFWHPPWNDGGTVKSRYEVPLDRPDVKPNRR